MNINELKKFCSPDEDRYSLHNPWTRDGYTWASNGHIIVRAPVIDGVPDVATAPNAALLLSKQEPPKTWLAVPDVQGPPMEECDNCHGSGECDCRCGDEHECGYCGGSGETTAPFVSVLVGDSQFANHYIAMLAGWEIAPNELNAAWIRNGDALGLLMPMRK